ncbi:hypothetical protein [Acinetobacter sp. NS4_7]
MNLIEQLGGYEKLKPHFVLTDRAIGYTHVYLHGNNHYCFLDERVDYIIPDRAILIKDVFDALLEYRRQHNIFEVGDKVIGSKLFDDRIFEFQYYLPELSMAVISKDGAAIGLNQLRHATPEEIKAGKRLGCYD